jgi:hypothetical protein
MAQLSVKPPSLTVAYVTGKKRKFTLVIPKNSDGSEMALSDPMTVDVLEVKDVSTKKRRVMEISVATTHYNTDYYFNMIGLILRLGFVNLTSLKLFGSDNYTKEVIETTSTIRFLKYYLKNNGLMTEAKTACICSGDGIGPAVGYPLACLNSDWTVLSVDPLMRQEWVDGHAGDSSYPSNLECKKDLIENVGFEHLANHDLILLISVHGHGNFGEVWTKLVALSCRVIGVSLPCCAHVNHLAPLPPVQSLNVIEIPSDKKMLHLWDSAKYAAM